MRRALLAAVLTIVAACSDSTGPGDDNSPPRLKTLSTVGNVNCGIDSATPVVCGSLAGDGDASVSTLAVGGATAG